MTPEQDLLNLWWMTCAPTINLIKQTTQLVFEFYLSLELNVQIFNLFCVNCICKKGQLASSSCPCNFLMSSPLGEVTLPSIRSNLISILSTLDTMKIAKLFESNVELYDRSFLKFLCRPTILTRRTLKKVANPLLGFLSIHPINKSKAAKQLVTSINHVCSNARAV